MPISCRRSWRRTRRLPRLRWSICRPTATSYGKSQLARGCVIPETAATVGRQLAFIHAAFAKSPTAAADFDTGASFHALRIEPYLLATARVHPDLASVLEALAERTEQTKLTVVHGDVSPKNILLGARGPVFLDAECAWFGDPAFDLAFCLNHLLLKTLWVPSAERELLTSFDALADAYLRGVDWEPAAALEQRAAQLLPALFLARIDGKSPVEYLTDDASKNAVRRAARSMLQQPLDRLDGVRRAWAGRDARKAADRQPATPARSHRNESSAGACGIHEAGRPSKRRSCSRVAQGGAVLRLQVRPPASTRPSIFAMAAARSAGWAWTAPWVMSARRSRTRSRGMSVMDQAAIDRTLIELDGTSNKARLGGTRQWRCRWPRCTRRPRRAPCRCGAISPTVTEPTLPMPMVQIFGGGAHAGRRVDIQDFLVVPIGASTFDEAIAIAVRIYESAGRIMAERGGLRGVADEGGWWPEFTSNSDALDALLLAIERAGPQARDRRGDGYRRRGVAAASRLALSLRCRESRDEQRRARRHPLAVVPPVSHRLCRGSAGPG